MKPTWQSDCGQVQLYLGDCRDILPHLGKVDAVVTDPPYGINHRRGVSSNRGKGSSLGADCSAWDAVKIDPKIFMFGQPVIYWGANWYSDKLPPGRWLLWDKQCHGGAGDFSEFEVAWFSSPGAIKAFRHMWLGVQRDSEHGKARLHPTQKPISLMAWCLSFLPKAKTILDPFMGSGTTGIACLRTGRKFIGIEISPKYFEIAKERIQRELAQLKLNL